MAKKKNQAARGGRAKPKTTTNSKKSNAGAPSGNGRASQAIGVVFMALGVLAGYLMWAKGGVESRTLDNLRAVLRGLAGMISYAMPVLLVGLGTVITFVGRKRIRPARALLAVLWTVVFCGVWHTFSADAVEQTMLTDSYREFIRASYREGVNTCAGAGAIGAVACWYPYVWLDKWGAAIALTAVLAVIAICLSRTSMREVGERISEHIAGGMDDYRQRRQVRGREKAELRAQSLERRVAREERERERREQHERLMQDERIRQEDARSRVSDLERRCRELADKRINVEDYGDYSDERREADAPVNHQPPAHTDAAVGDEQSAPAESPRPEARPVMEDDLEAVKSRSRGDQQAYFDEMKRRMAQEGVPMFLDKRVPGRVLTKTGTAPAQELEKQPKQDGAPQLVFSGYDEPGSTPAPDDASYAPQGYAVSPLPDAPRSVLELDEVSVPPANDAPAHDSPAPAPSLDEISIRPLRGGRSYDADEHLSHASASVRRIAESHMRAEAARMEQPTANAAYTNDNYDAEYDAPYEPLDDEPRATAQSAARNSAPVFANAPAPGSAYAAGTDYEDGMPFERYTEPGALTADAPAAEPDDELADYKAPEQPVKAYGEAPAQTQPLQPKPVSAPSHPEQLAEYEPLAEPTYTAPAQPARPAMAVPAMSAELANATENAQADELDELPEFDSQPENISFDGYTGEGGVNEEIAVQHTPEIVPETATRVAMYTPVSADLERGVGSGTRPDGTPIRMPKAMEEIPQDKPYFYPPIDLLQFSQQGGVSLKEQQQLDAEKAQKLEDTLQSFGIQAKVVGVSRGPAITRFEMTPAPGVRVSKISGLADDIALNLAATTVRIEAPIPGKSAVGIELPNEHREMVTLRDVLDSPEARKAQSKLAVALGKDNAGKLVIADIAKMPHVLIAGATGSGKSVCINTIIMSIIYRATPDEVRLILIDPKVVELSVYNGVPHLLVPVVTDPKKAASALNWAVLEMTERYQKFAERGVRDIRGYNNNLKDGEKPLPQIVVIIDELADLMMVAPGEVEDAICRLAQLARAAGIHLVIATQRPSVNVITGVIKANIPSRIAFTVASQVDSRTILDGAGAEKLLGRGDMLFFPQGVSKPQRVQGANVTDEEVTAVTEFIKSQHEAVYNPDILEQMESAEQSDAEKEDKKDDECDPLLSQAIGIAVELGQVSISMLQRRMRIGYARAGRIVDDMTARGIIGAADGAKPRMVLISREEYKRLYEDAGE